MGAHVFENAILRMLVRRNITVILVTHQLRFANHADQVCFPFPSILQAVSFILFLVAMQYFLSEPGDGNLFEFWAVGVPEQSVLPSLLLFIWSTSNRVPYICLKFIARTKSCTF